MTMTDTLTDELVAIHRWSERPPAVEYADDYELALQFDGSGSALTAGLGGQVEVPASGRIVGARLFVGRSDPASSATVNVWLGTYVDYPTGLLLHGTGTVPTLTAAVKSPDLPLTGWIRNIRIRDTLSWQLMSFSGPATKLTLALLIRQVPTGIPVIGVVDAAGDTLVTVAGDQIALRR